MPPTGNTETFPIQPKDVLVLPQGSYVVSGVLSFEPHYIAIYVEIPVS